MKNAAKKSIVIVLSAAVAMSSAGIAFAEPLKRNETVYIKLDNSGNAKSMDVVNWIDTKGKTSVEDITSLENIKPVSDRYKLDLSGGRITANLGGDKSGNFFYTGTTTKQLPVSVDISYYLDGKKVEARDLGGKSGSVEIKIDLRNVTGKKEPINYFDFVSKKSLSYDDTVITPFMANVTMDLPLDRFKDVEAPDSGTVVAGKVMKLNWLKFPYPDETISVKFTAQNFELDPISITLIPQMPPVSTPDISGKLEEMYDGISAMDTAASALSNGAGSLLAGSRLLSDGLNTYFDGVESALVGAGQLNGGVPALSQGMQDMINAAGSLNQAGNAQIQMVDSISAINAELEKAIQTLSSVPGMEKNAQGLLAGLQQQKALLDIMSNGGKLPDGRDFPGLKTSTAGINQLYAGMNSYKAGLDKSAGGIAALYSGLQQLSASRSAIKGGSDQLDAGIQKLQGGIDDVRNQGILKLKSGLSDQMNELNRGMALKSQVEGRVNDYTSFTGSKDNGAGKAEFLMQTDTIKPASSDVNSNSAKEEKSDDKGNIFSRIVKVFKNIFD